MSETIKDSNGKVIGRINNDRGYTFGGKFVGRYDENTNTTYDSNGRRVGSGNQVTGLLYTEEHKEDS
jgi:hypothetical protein